MIDLHSIQTFLKVVDFKSFTKAARQVGRTQSAVSQQMTKLEQTLGKALFKRGKDMTLTPQGEIFLHYAKKIYELFREALDHFQNPDLKGEIRFGLPEDFASVFLSDLLVDFTQMHPKISLGIECDLTLKLYEKFKRKEFEIVLLKMSHPREFPYGQEVFSENLEWVGSSTYELSKHPLHLVLAPSPCVYRSAALKALDQSKTSWRIAFTSPSYNGTLAAVKAGLGITVLPKSMIPSELIVLHSKKLPQLGETHVCLLKHSNSMATLNSLEQYLLQKLNRFNISVLKKI